MVLLTRCGRERFAACGQPMHTSSSLYCLEAQFAPWQKPQLVFWEMPKCKKNEIKPYWITLRFFFWLSTTMTCPVPLALGCGREWWVRNGPSAPRLIYARLTGHSREATCKCREERGLNLDLSSGFSSCLPTLACSGRFGAAAGATRVQQRARADGQNGRNWSGGLAPWRPALPD